MISVFVGIVGIVAGAALFAPEETKTEPQPIMQCSLACGPERMTEYQITHGVCKCGEVR